MRVTVENAIEAALVIIYKITKQNREMKVLKEIVKNITNIYQYFLLILNQYSHQGS